MIRKLTVCIFAMIFAGLTVAADKPKTPARPTSKPTPRHQLTDYGPFVTATIPTQWPEGGIVNKAIAIKLPGGKGGMLFDTDTLRIAAGWTGGFLEFTKDLTSIRDAKTIKMVGAQMFGTKIGPGWANPETGDLKEPRANGFGPIPRPWAKYRGLYLHGDQVVLSYSVGECDVLEMPGIETYQGIASMTRSFELGKSEKALKLLVCEKDDAAANVASGSAELKPTNGLSAQVGLFGQPEKVRLVAGKAGAAGQVFVEIPAAATPCRFRLAVWNRFEKGTHLLPGMPPAAPADLKSFTHGGPPRWNQPITTTGLLNTSGGKEDAYVVDTLTLPEVNPWKSLIRPGGFDFFTSDPTKAAMCSWGGDVWVVSGIDAELKSLKWQRIATGLYQPLGLKIVKDEIYVVGRDQITVLHDLNGDGEADFYENFTNDFEVTSNFHEFMFDLHTDPAGYFYCAKAGPVKNGGQGFEEVAAHHGSVLKISPDGRSVERYATGFRAPNGIGVSPDGQVTTGDNEGTWVPMCRINWVKPGGFYGVVDTAHRAEKPTTYDGPLCWMPKEVDNSSGCQVWVMSEKLGPLQGHMLHLSYGTCSLFLVLKEEINGQTQGGVVRFPLKFDAGIMRARFNPGDGQLYVAGLKGWQTTAGKDGCLQRVRYTGKPVRMPTELHIAKIGMQVGFITPLDAKEAADPANYAVERWNYLWSQAYGSAHYSVANPSKKGHDEMEIQSASVSADGKSVTLGIRDLKAVMQSRLDLRVSGADGAPVKYDIYHTIHEVGGE